MCVGIDLLDTLDCYNSGCRKRRFLKKKKNKMTRGCCRIEITY